MKKRLLALVLTLICALGLLPAASATDTVPCLTVDSSLVIIGDSNTVYLKKNNPDIQPARIYARVNAGIAECVENYSRYYADGYSRSMYELISALSGDSFRTVVVNIGTNNAGTPSATFRSYYRRLLELLLGKNPNAVIYLCKILPINPRNYNGNYPQIFTTANINRINGVVQELQAEYAALGYDARIMDLNTPFRNAAGVLLPEYDLGGGIHLTTKGYKRLNQVVQTALAQGDPEANHSWTQPETLTPPSCGSPGMARRFCAVCGAEGLLTLAPTGRHSWDGGTTLTPPDCVTAGRARYACAVCGVTEERSVPALGHAWTLTERLTEPEAGFHGGTARYLCRRCGQEKTASLCAAEVFADMPPEGHWSHDPIDWAYFSGVSSGKSPSRFAPEDGVSRAEAMSFLWTALGRPAHTLQESPFADVTPGKYYYDPVLWAYENHITSGLSTERFGPRRDCTRAQIVSFLWNAAGQPAPGLTENPFTDISEDKYYYSAVLWAYENHVTGGVSAERFGPNRPCTRAQTVAFLWRACPLLTK